MKQLILILSVFLISINVNAQSERAQRKFIMSIFKDIKKNRLENVTDKFVDSLFIDRVLEIMKEKDPKFAKFLKKEKIQAQRIKAEKRLLRSLKNAYSKLNNTNGGIGRAKLVDIEFQEKESKGITMFSAVMKIEIEELEATLSLSELTYEAESGLYFIMSDKARVRFIDPNERYEREIEEDIEKVEVIEEVEVTDDAEDR